MDFPRSDTVVGWAARCSNSPGLSSPTWNGGGTDWKTPPHTQRSGANFFLTGLVRVRVHEQLRFQRGKEALYDGIVPTIPRPTHGTLQAVQSELLLVARGRLLTAAIRVMEHTASTLSLNNVSNINSGTYSVVISGTCGKPVTNSATLTVNLNTTASPLPDLARNAGATVTFPATVTATAAPVGSVPGAETMTTSAMPFDT